MSGESCGGVSEMLARYEVNYAQDAWQEYSLAELGQWVHLYAKRAEHRATREARDRDLQDAQNYLSMMQARLDELKRQ